MRRPLGRSAAIVRIAAAATITAWLGAAGAALAARSEPGSAEPPAKSSYESSIVGVRVTFQRYDPDRPWAKDAPDVRFPLAVFVGERSLLTTAHVVADATFVQVEKLGTAGRVPARVVLTDPEIDLALLTVDEPKFFDDLTPVRMADGVPLEGSLQTVGIRNRRLEISSSRIARFEVQTSVLGTVEHPFLSVFTDFRGGGWSEPVFSDGALVGVTASQNEQTARILPIDVIAPFLRMATAGGDYPGFPNLSFRWQDGDDPTLAAYLGLPGPPRGIVVNQVPAGSSACGVLRPRDLLLSLDGHAIDADGFYRHSRYGLMRFTYIPVEDHRAGDVLPAEVWRDGKSMKLDIPLRRADSLNDLIPDLRPDEAPAFLVAGGLVLREFDGTYLRSWGDDWRRKAPVELLIWRALYSDQATPERRRILLMSSVLPSAYNVGYHDIRDVPVQAINGRPVDSVSAAEEAFRHPEGRFHVITLSPNADRARIVLDATTFEAETARILEEYRIPERIRVEAPRPDLGPACR